MPDCRSKRLNRHIVFFYTDRSHTIFTAIRLCSRFEVSGTRQIYAKYAKNIKGKVPFSKTFSARSQISAAILNRSSVSCSVCYSRLYTEYCGTCWTCSQKMLMAPDVECSTLFARSSWSTRGSYWHVWNSISLACTSKGRFFVPRHPSRWCSFVSEFEHKNGKFYHLRIVSHLSATWTCNLKKVMSVCLMNSKNSNFLKLTKI